MHTPLDVECLLLKFQRSTLKLQPIPAQWGCKKLDLWLPLDKLQTAVYNFGVIIIIFTQTPLKQNLDLYLCTLTTLLDFLKLE
jgi:hypothetical protein